MLLPEKEKRLLKDLIGRKVDGVFIPFHDIAKPVEVYIRLSNGEILKIDSCTRAQQPTETIKRYPQLRVRHVSSLPQFPTRQLLSQSGELVQSIRLISEQVQTDHEFIVFTCGLSLRLTGHQKVTILRESFRSPGLNIRTSELRPEDIEEELTVHYRTQSL